MTYRKVGGLHHWRIGRVGGSFYLRKSNCDPVKAQIAIVTASIAILAAVLSLIA